MVDESATGSANLWSCVRPFTTADAYSAGFGRPLQEFTWRAAPIHADLPDERPAKTQPR